MKLYQDAVGVIQTGRWAMQRKMLSQQLNDEFALVPHSRILLVDEDIEDLEYHARLLEGQGHDVFASGSYDRGAELAETGDYDFVMVSQGSPAFEGKVVLERIKESRQENRLLSPTPWDTPVLVLTHCLDMGCYLEAMQLGAVDYVEKPVRPTEMRRILKAHLQPRPVV
jgi:putative two-component system response regulator